MRCYLDRMLGREWLGKSSDDYGGAKDHELHFGSAALVHVFELKNCKQLKCEWEQRAGSRPQGGILEALLITGCCK